MQSERGRWAHLAGFVVLVLAITAGAAPAAGQDFRGSITGTVKDTSGGVMPGVTVTITNTQTGVSQNVVTNGDGQYQVLYLNAGTYSVTAELSGFKKIVQSGNQLHVGDLMRIDVTLETGGVQETVTVTTTAPVLNTTAVSGTTVDATQIQELPLGDGTAYMLTRLAPGIVDTSDLHFARPMDNGNLSGIVSNGVQGGNEFSIDGAPNLSNARGVGFSPPSDAISEFKVQTNAFDAQTGHTAGAVVNLALKSGTNTLHGATGYFNRDAKRTETPLLSERAGGPKPSRTYNRFTETVNGPIRKDKTFFLVSYEHLRDVQPEPASYTVPTAKMRAGDFSEFPTLIYDPATVTSGGVRSPFLNNQIPAGRINPIAAAYAALYPEPNRPSTESNYFTNQLRPYDYNAIMGRVDHNITEASRIFTTVYFNKRQEDRYDWAKDAANSQDGVINGFAVTKGFDYRTNLGFTGGYTSTLSQSTVLDVRGSLSRFGEYRDPAQTFDPAKLGYSSSTVALMNGYQYLPLMTFASFSTTNANSTIASLGAQRSDFGEGFNRPMYFVSAAPTVTRFWGDHTSRAGYDLRYQRWDITNSGFPGGRYQFNGAYTRASNSAATNDRAQSFAQFLLGLPTATTGAVATPATQSSQFEIASPGSFTQFNNGLFLQDDWRVGSNLTVNLGLRFEMNTGMSEIENRNLSGFDTTTPNPIEPQAKAAYAAAPIPELPVSSFHVPGGLQFADGPVNHTNTKILPRGAMSYLLGEKTVIRGGAGMFSYDYFFENINQSGFSQATPVVATSDNGITFTGATLSNPIPGGSLIQPVGSSLGLRSQLGQNLGTLYQPGRETPHYTRWEINLQRDLGDRWIGYVGYLGSRGRDLAVTRQFNNIPMQFLSTSRSRDAATETQLTANVPSPFAGLLPGSTINGATVQRQQLLRPFPEFGTFAIEEYSGSDRYNAVSLQAEKRFLGGDSFTVQYTYSSLHDKLNFLNPADSILEDRVSPNDRPHRFSLAGIGKLPFGKDQRWGRNWNGVVQAILGDWQASGTYQYQSGYPLLFTSSLYYDANRDPRDLKSNIGQKINGQIAGLDIPAWDLSGFYFHDSAVQTGGVDDPAKQRADQRIVMANNVRYFPSTLPNLRTDNLHLMDFGLSKSFDLPSRMKLQLRIEAINAINYTVLWNPGLDPRNSLFGFINQDRNNPRDFQLGARLTF